MPKEMSFEERIRLPKDIWSSLSQALSTFKRGRPSHRSIFLLALFTTLFSTLSFAMEPGEEKAQAIQGADTPMQSFCRVTLGGARRSGRSSFVSTLKGEAFNVNRQSTPGIEVSRILRNGIQYSVWDHGVSSVSRAYDRMFLAHHEVYLVVFNMMNLVPSESEIAVQTALSYLGKWMCDIQEHSLQQPPVVFLIGTHRDKIKEEYESQLKAIDDLLRQKFGSHPAFQNAQQPTEGEAIGLCFFPLSNRDGLHDSMLQHLLREMDHFVTSSNPLENTTYVLPLINKIIRNHGLQDAIGDREINDRRWYGESYWELKWEAKLEPRLLDLLWKDHKKELRDKALELMLLFELIVPVGDHKKPLYIVPSLWKPELSVPPDLQFLIEFIRKHNLQFMFEQLHDYVSKESDLEGLNFASIREKFSEFKAQSVEELEAAILDYKKQQYNEINAMIQHQSFLRSFLCLHGLENKFEDIYAVLKGSDLASLNFASIRGKFNNTKLKLGTIAKLGKVISEYQKSVLQEEQEHKCAGI